MAEPIKLNGSSYLQFKDGTHQPQLKIKGFTDNVIPVEGGIPSGETEIHQKSINVSIHGVSNHNYQLQISQDLQAWQNYGQLLTVDDVDGMVTNISGVDVEEIVVSKPIHSDKEFYRVSSTRTPGAIHTKLDDLGISGYLEYVLRNPNQSVMEYCQFLMNNLSSKVDISFSFDELILAFPNKEDALAEIQQYCGLKDRAIQLNLDLGSDFDTFPVEVKKQALKVIEILEQAELYKPLEEALSYEFIVFNANISGRTLDEMVAFNYGQIVFGVTSQLKRIPGGSLANVFTFDMYLKALNINNVLSSNKVNNYYLFLLSNSEEYESIKEFANVFLEQHIILPEEYSFEALYKKGMNVISAMAENINILKVYKAYPGFIPEKKTYSNAEDVVINSIAKMIDEGLSCSIFSYNQLLLIVEEYGIKEPVQLIDYLEFMSNIQANVLIEKNMNSEDIKIKLSVTGGLPQTDFLTANIMDSSGKLIKTIYAGNPVQNLSVLWDRRDNSGAVVNGPIKVELVCEKYIFGTSDIKKEMSYSSTYSLNQLFGIFDNRVTAVETKAENTEITYVTGYIDNGVSDKSYGADTDRGFELKCPQRISVYYADSDGDSAYYADMTKLNANNQWEGVRTFRDAGTYYLDLMPAQYNVHINNPCWWGDKYVLYNISYKTPQLKKAVFDKYGAKISENVATSSFSEPLKKSVIVDNEEISPLYVGSGYIELLRKDLITSELSKLNVDISINADNFFLLKQFDGNLLMTWQDKTTKELLSKVIDICQVEHDWQQLDWEDRAFSKTELVEHGLISENIKTGENSTEIIKIYVDQSFNVINAISPVVTHDVTLEELISLCRYKNVIEQYFLKSEEADQCLRNIVMGSNVIQSIDQDLANKSGVAVNWLQDNGYVGIDKNILLTKPYATIAIYNAVKSISCLSNDIKVNINDLFTSYDESISNNYFNVNVLTDFLRLNNIYKGNNLFKDSFSGNVEEQRKCVQPRYEDILMALELRKSLQGITTPLQYISETAAEINILLNNVDYQKMVAFHRYVMDLNSYATALKLPEYIISHGKLSYSDYFAGLNNGANPGLINCLATKHYFDSQVTPGEANIYIDTVGSYKLLYSGQAIFVQEAGDIYYRMSKIVMPSHFSVIEKAINLNNGGIISTTTSIETPRVVPSELQRELWLYLIQQGYLTSKGIITKKFIDMQSLANASANKDQYILDNFHLSPNLAGYEVSAFKKIEEMGLGNWSKVTDNMIRVGGEGWVNTADHTLEIARKTGTTYTTLKTITNTYFDATSFAGLFKDISTLSEADTLPYSNDKIADWCFELNELMSDSDLFNQTIPDLKPYLSYRNVGKSVLHAYLAAYFEKLDAIHDTAGGFPKINYTIQDIQNIYNQLSSPIASDLFAKIEGLTTTQSVAIINLLKASGVITSSGALAFNYDITNSAQNLGLEGTVYDQYAHQIFTLLTIEKKAVERKFFRIIINLVDIQSRLSQAERATSYELKDYVYLSEDFHNYNPDQIVKLRDMFAMSNILGKKLTANSIQSLINVYDNSGNALDAVLASGGLMSVDVQKVVDEYEPIINAVKNITENVICTFDASGQNGVLRIGELKNIASLKVYHKDELVYIDNDYDGLDFVKDIPIPNGSSIDPIRLEIVYVDGISEPKIVYPLAIDASSNTEDVKFLKVLDEMSRELDNSLELYGLKYGEELMDYKPYIAELGKMYISAKVLALKGNKTPALSAKDIVNAYSTALISQEFPDTPMPDDVWKKVWLINNRDKLSLFDDSIKSLMMKASVDLKEDSTEINKKGERYQLLIGGLGYTHGADCGNTAGFGDAKVIGVMDTFTGQVIQVPSETIATSKDVKWISDTGQLERKQRDLAVESAQRSLNLKSFYACKMGEYSLPENSMHFDVSTTTSWRDLVADSETAVASYAKVLEERKHFIVDLMRNVTGNSSLSEADARAMYDKFLTLFQDYLPNSKNSLSIVYPSNNMNYIHKDNEPRGLYISKEAILILQRMKNAGVNVTSVVNGSYPPTQALVTTYVDAETIGQVKATKLLSANISTAKNGQPAINVTPTITNLYGGILKNILSELFGTELTISQAIETLPIIQAKYPNLISDAELGSIGVATFAMLSYLQVINYKSLMSKFKTLDDLPEKISLEAEEYQSKTGTAFKFMKITDNGMIEVVFSPSGQVTSSVYSDGKIRTKTLNSMAANTVESFVDDEFKVETNSDVKIGAISSFSPQYPRSGAYNEYGWVNIVGEIAKNIVLAMIIGEVTGLLANMAGMKDLYTLYSTTQRSVDIAKAGINGEMQQLVNNVVGKVLPTEIVNVASDAYGAYKTFETQYNTIKSDIDKYVNQSIAGLNTVEQLNQIQSSVNTTLQATQTQLNQLKQDVLNKVGVYANMTEEQLKKASESLMALERQVAYTRYEMEQKIKAMGKKVPGVDIPVQVCLLAEEEIPNICETVKNASGEDIQITMTGSEGLFEINTPNSMLKIRNGFPVAYSNKQSGNVGVFTFNQVISGEKSIDEYLQNVGEMISREIGETSYFLYDLPGMKIDIKDVVGESVSVSVNSGLSKRTELLYDFNKGTIVTKSYGFSEKEKSGLLGTLKKQLITIIMNKSVIMAKSTKEEWEKINKVIDPSKPRLTSEELTKQLAVMSDWVYFWENDPNIFNRKKYAENLALIKANGWTQYYEEGYDQSMENAVNYDNKTGYYGRILINNNSKQIVFVHRGTEFDRGGLTSVLDIVSDVAILFGMNLQVSSAKKLYESFFKSNPTYKGYEIIHTGHSLGGAIAQEMAIMYNRNNGDKAVCFAGLGIYERIKKWEKMNKGQSIDFINNYVVAEDALLWIYPQAGSLFIENKNGSEFNEEKLQKNQINLRSFIINMQEYTSAHSMEYYKDGYHPAANHATYEKLKYYWLAYRTISDYSNIFSRWGMDNITPIGLIRKIGE